ncbi:hypothetical protein ACFQS3_20155 [Glycomyces mayteni]|uniref:Uncharacterized protein n=1 Tax=Glycomyces mayteni TaxID=543887 RepID=A0ABW2DAY1_9ACTN
MAVPPQYPVYPYPPGPYAYPYGGPPRRPGLTTTAVVLMWVQVGLGLLGGIGTAVTLTAGRDVFEDFYPGLAAWVPLVLLVSAVQALGFAALRGLFAVGIMDRRASARRGAFAVEGVSIAFQIAWQAVFLAALRPAGGGVGVNIQFDCTGIVLSVLILCFLGATKSARWCDR